MKYIFFIFLVFDCYMLVYKVCVFKIKMGYGEKDRYVWWLMCVYIFLILFFIKIFLDNLYFGYLEEINIWINYYSLFWDINVVYLDSL